MNFVRFALPIFVAAFSVQIHGHAQVLAPEPGPLKIRQIIPGKKLVVATQGTVTKVDMEKIYLATFSDGKQCELRTVGQNQTYITLDGSACDKFGLLVLNADLEPSLHVIDEPLEIPEDRPAAKAAAPVAAKGKSLIPSPANSPARSIADQGYMVPGRSLGIEASWKRMMQDSSYYSGTTLLTESKTYRTTLGFEAAYGITDNLNFMLAMSVVPGEVTELKTLNQSLYSKGLEDPTASLAYRLVEQSDVSPLDVIVNLNYSPKIYSAKSSTDDAEGTAASGRSELGFDLMAFRKFENVELGLQLGYRSLWAGSRSNADTGEITETGARESYFGGFVSQLSVSKSLYLNAMLAFSSFSSGEDKNVQANTLTRSGSYSAAGVLLGVRLVLIPDTALLDFTASRMKAGDYDIVTSTSKISLRDLQQDTLGASIRYVF